MPLFFIFLFFTSFNILSIYSKIFFYLNFTKPTHLVFGMKTFIYDYTLLVNMNGIKQKITAAEENIIEGFWLSKEDVQEALTIALELEKEINLDEYIDNGE